MTAVIVRSEPRARPGSVIPVPQISMRVGVADGWTLDDSRLGRLDAGNVLEGASDGFIELGGAALTLDITVGTSNVSNFTAINPATCRVRFADPNRDLDPNGTGRYSSRVRYGCPIRVRIGGQQRFYGFLWTASWANGVTTVVATDHLSKLAAVSLTAEAAQGDGESGTARIGRYVAQSAVPVTIVTGDGTSIARQATDLSGNVLSNISAVVDTEWGLLEPVAGGESYRYWPSWYTGRRVAVGFWLTDNMLWAVSEAGSSGIDTARIVNSVTVKTPNLADVETSDTDSMSLYGRRTLDKTTDFVSSADVSTYAQSLLDRYSEPVPTTPQQLRFVINDTNLAGAKVGAGSLITFLVERELLGRYLVINTTIGWSGTPFVIGYSISYTPRNQYTVNVSLADFGGAAIPGVLRLDRDNEAFLDYGRTLK